MRKTSLFALLAAVALPCHAADTASTLRDKALTDPTAFNLVESLTTEIGPRPVGSPAAIRARDWALAKLKALGFTNVHAEAFAKPSWQRGAESAEVITPFPQKLAILGLGNSVPTPPKGIEAPVVVLNSYAELLAAGPGAFKGKIVVVNQPMTRTEDGSGYGAAVVARGGDIEAAKRGALAYLVRSVSTASNRAPHTGTISTTPGAVHIPAAALGVPDADLLQRMTARGPVRLRLKLASSTNPKSLAWNISGEVAGSGKPDEIIVIGGHLDSWDPGTGAVDDAAGIAITAGAASLINQLPAHPRRTIRVVLFGSEENGGSSEAYAAAHKDEHIVLAGESDLGSDRPIHVALPEAAAFPALPAVLAPLKVFVEADAPKHGGSDITGLQKAGVPIFAVQQEASRYFDVHHSADDTLAVVDRDQLNQNVATWVSLLYQVADSNVDFRAKPAN